MVLALSLPESMPNRSLLITMTFGVVALSILGQGFSMPALLPPAGQRPTPGEGMTAGMPCLTKEY